MADGGSSKVPWIVPIAVAVIGLIASPVWGPPLCQAVGVCDKPGAAPSTGPAPTFAFPTVSFAPNVETNIFLSLTSGPAGSKFKVSGEGFQAGETVVLRMSTTEIGRTTASPAGQVRGVVVAVPNVLGVFAGIQFTVTATGSSSVRFATAPFTVSG